MDDRLNRWGKNCWEVCHLSHSSTCISEQYPVLSPTSPMLGDTLWISEPNKCHPISFSWKASLVRVLALTPSPSFTTSLLFPQSFLALEEAGVLSSPRGCCLWLKCIHNLSPFVHQQGGAHSAGCATPALFSPESHGLQQWLAQVAGHYVFLTTTFSATGTCQLTKPWSLLGSNRWKWVHRAEWVLQTARKKSNKQVSRN